MEKKFTAVHRKQQEKELRGQACQQHCGRPAYADRKDGPGLGLVEKAHKCGEECYHLCRKKF